MRKPNEWSDDSESGYLSDTTATVLGVLLAFAGVWGLFSARVFRVFTTNLTHALVHLALGITGVALGLSGRSRRYCVAVGAVLVGVSVLRVLPGTGRLVAATLNVNAADVAVNFAFGAWALFVGWVAGRPRWIGAAPV